MSLNNLFWDSCVLIRYLISDPNAEALADIAQFVEDARRGDRTIYMSSLALTEIRPRYLKQGGFETMQDFLADIGSLFRLVDPSPQVYIDAGVLRDADSINPNPKDKGRPIGTPDSIQLMTCLYIRDVLGVSDIVFHSFDAGTGRTWEGKTVPLLGFERWFPEGSRTPSVERVLGLTRCQPSHPAPDMIGFVSNVSSNITTRH